MSETATSNETVKHQAATDGIDLLQGESVLQNRRPSWVLWWKQIVVALLVGLGGASNGSPELLIFGGIIFAYIVFSRMQSRYIVTDERVKMNIGVLSNKSREYRIPDIQSLSTSQSIFERLFGDGSVTLRTASNDKITWVSVPEYNDVANSIREEQRKYD